jgi:acyl carrier protein
MARENPMMDTVKQFILDEFLPGEDPGLLTPTTPLMSAGILDSLATLKLIVFIEKEFNIQIEAYEASVEQMDTLERICRLIESKR